MFSYRLSRLSRFGIAATLALGTCLPYAAAQASGTYPAYPIKIEVPFSAGGAADVSARLLGSKVSEILGQPVIVEDRPGAGSNIGANFVSKAKPDGYTLLLGTSAALAVNISLYKNLPFNPAKDFTPIITTTLLPSIVVVSKDSKIQTIAQLNAHLKEPGVKAFYASSGIGTPSHLGTELYLRTIGGHADHVPYNGGAPALADMVANRADFFIDVVPEAMPLVQGGQLRALAVTTPRRLAYLPNLPTLAESGVPGYELTAWYAIVAPAKTPPAIVAKLNAAFNQALKDPAIVAKLHVLGFDPAGGTPDDLAKLMASETTKWAAVIKSAHIVMP